MAAYWAISWPAGIAALGSALMFATLFSAGSVTNHALAIGFAANLAFFAVQAFLTPRLVQKDFRTFRVVVVHEDGQRIRHLTMREASRVAFWIVWPQAAFLIVAAAFIWRFGAGLSAIVQWLRFLVAGPYSAGVALRVKYPGFRFETYGFRYI